MNPDHLHCEYSLKCIFWSDIVKRHLPDDVPAEPSPALG
jgi:hypothetical protein